MDKEALARFNALTATIDYIRKAEAFLTGDEFKIHACHSCGTQDPRFAGDLYWSEHRQYCEYAAKEPSFDIHQDLTITLMKINDVLKNLEYFQKEDDILVHGGIEEETAMVTVKFGDGTTKEIPVEISKLKIKPDMTFYEQHT